MTFVYMVKSLQYKHQTEEEIVRTLKDQNIESFQEIENLWVPAFSVKESHRNVGNTFGLGVDLEEDLFI